MSSKKLSIDELYERICNEGPTPQEVFDDVLTSCIPNEEFNQRTGGSVVYYNGVMNEYDTIYSNDTSVLIAYIAYEGGMRGIKEVQRQMNTYKLHRPYYKNHKLYGCLAVFEMTTEVRQAALAAGLIVFVKDKESVVRILNA